MDGTISNTAFGSKYYEEEDENDLEETSTETLYSGYGEGSCTFSSPFNTANSPRSESELLDMILHECGADETKRVPAAQVVKVLQKRCLSPEQNEILSEILKEMEESDEIIDCSSLQAISSTLGEFIDGKSLSTLVSTKDSCIHSEENTIASEGSCISSDYKTYEGSAIAEGPCSPYFYNRRRSVADLTEEIKSLLHQNSKLSSENTRLKKQITESDDMHQHLIQESDELKKKLKSMEKQLLEKNKELQMQNDDLKACLQASEEAKTLLESNLKISQQANHSLDSQLKNSEKKLQQTQTDLTLVKKREKQLFNSLTDEKQLAQKLLEEKALLEEKLIQRNSQNEDLQQALNDFTEISKVVHNEKDELEKRLSTLLNQNASFVESVARSTLGSGEPLQQQSCHVESLDNEKLNDAIPSSIPGREACDKVLYNRLILPISVSNQPLGQEIEEANIDITCIKQIGKDLQGLKSQVSHHNALFQSLLGNCHLSFPAIIGQRCEFTKENGLISSQQTGKDNDEDVRKEAVSCFFNLLQTKRAISFRCELILFLVFIVVKLFIYSYFFTCGYKQYYSSVLEKSLDIILWPFFNIQTEKPPI